MAKKQIRYTQQKLPTLEYRKWEAGELAQAREHAIEVEEIRKEKVGQFPKAMVDIEKGKGALRKIETTERQIALGKYFIGIAGVIILWVVIIGPGTFGLIEGLLEVSWYYWVLAIFILLIMLRRTSR